MDKVLLREQMAHYLIALDEVRLTLQKYCAGMLSEYTTKEHLRIDLEKIIVWMEDY